jgi:hypothetical protein
VTVDCRTFVMFRGFIGVKIMLMIVSSFTIGAEYTRVLSEPARKIIKD